MTKELTDLKHTISAMTDDEILSMLTNDYADYRQEALEFASEELTRRGFEVNNIGYDFDIVTPNHIQLHPLIWSWGKNEYISPSFAIGPGGVPAWAYIVAALSGVVVPLIVIIVPLIFLFQFSTQFDSSDIAESSLLFLVLLPILGIMIVVIFVYAGLGAIFGYKWPEQNWKWGLWVTVPSLTLSFAGRGLSNPDDLSAIISSVIPSILFVLLPACQGARWGTRRKARKQTNQAPREA
jgi:hypothetical protein